MQSLDESLANYFLFGKIKQGTLAWNLHTTRDSNCDCQKMWDDYEDILLSIWNKSGNRGMPWFLRNEVAEVIT